LATIRLRRIITASAVTVALAATMAPPALAAGIRVEGPKATIYQGTVRPATGSLVEGLAPAEHRGLPAYAGEGLFEGRAVVRLPTRSGRRPT